MLLYFIRGVAAVVIGGLVRNYLGKRPKAWLVWAVPGVIGLLLKFCLVESSIANLASLFLYMAAGGLVASLVIKFRPEETPASPGGKDDNTKSPKTETIDTNEKKEENENHANL